MRARSSITALVSAVLLPLALLSASCENRAAESNEDPDADLGEITVDVIGELVNYHSMAFSWESTLQDSTIAYRYLVGIADTDTLTILTAPVFEVDAGSQGAVIPFTGFPSDQTFWIWMAAVRIDGTSLVVAHESPKLPFTTCPSPYATEERTPRTLTGVRLASAGSLVYAAWPDGVFEQYDPGASQWSTLPPMLSVRTDFAMVGSGGVVYAIGGEASDAVDVYDPGTGAWASAGTVPAGVAIHSAVALGDTVYAFSSLDRIDPSRDWASYPTDRRMLAYDTSTGEWLERASRPGGDVMGPLAVLGDTLFMFGSFSAGPVDYGFVNATAHDSVYAYIPSKDRWLALGELVPAESIPTVPDSRAGFDAVTVGDRIYLVGGTLERPDDTTAVVWSVPQVMTFDGDSQPWALRTVPGSPLDFGADGAAVASGGVIYFVNGGSRWPTLLGAYAPVLDKCGFDLTPWDTPVPYAIAYTGSGKPGREPSTPHIRMGAHRPR